MSLNTAHANGGVLIFNGEWIILYCDGVELKFEGQNGKEFSGTKKGRLYLTSHRMIFNNSNSSDPMQSFSFPFFSMTGIGLEQPIFGANFIKGTVNAQVGGNWTGQSIFKLKFLTGGAIEFGQALLQAARNASRHMPPQPPPYTPQPGPYYPAQPPAYTPPPGGFQGFVPPTHVFPNAPPANTVFMTDMPPPYPGIYPPAYAAPQAGGYPQPGSVPYQQQPAGYPPTTGYPGYNAGPPPPGFNAATLNGMPPPSSNNNQPPMYGSNAAAPPEDSQNLAANAKAQEAMQSAYYNPHAPHQVYMPQQNPYQQQQFDGPPPPYSEASKKDQ